MDVSLSPSFPFNLKNNNNNWFHQNTIKKLLCSESHYQESKNTNYRMEENICKSHLIVSTKYKQL